MQKEGKGSTSPSVRPWKCGNQNPPKPFGRLKSKTFCYLFKNSSFERIKFRKIRTVISGCDSEISIFAPQKLYCQKLEEAKITCACATCIRVCNLVINYLRIHSEMSRQVDRGMLTNSRPLEYSWREHFLLNWIQKVRIQEKS